MCQSASTRNHDVRLGFERYTKAAATRKAAEAQGLKLARQLAVVREKARTDREALEVMRLEKSGVSYGALVHIRYALARSVRKISPFI